MEDTNIKIVNIKGTYYEMGLEHGRQCKDLIDSNIKANLAALLHSVHNKALANLSSEDLKKFTQRWIPYAQEYAPELIEGMKGIADGSEHTFEEIFFLNAFLDHHDYTYPQAAQRLMFGCTTFAATDTAVVKGDTIIGQTYDISSVFEPQVILLRGTPEIGRPFNVLTMAGVVAWNGVNIDGISVVINRLTPNDGRPGIPYPMVVRKILEKSTISQATDMVLRARRASGINYLIADKDGDMVDLETSATDYQYIGPNQDILWHTNHYVTLAMRPYSEYHRPYAGESIIRYLRMEKLLKKHHGSINVETLKQFTRDHNNYPLSICRHPVDDAEIMARANTAAAMITNLTERKMWIVVGNPCEHNYLEMSF